MQDFYRHSKLHGQDAPAILGLSASPVLNSKLVSLSRIEETLDAMCRTPTLHKQELMANSNMPELRQIVYDVDSPGTLPVQNSAMMVSLHTSVNNLDIEEDPWIISLRAEDTDRSRRSLEKALLQQKTNCRDQLKAFCSTSLHIYDELGLWAADYYISETMARFIAAEDSTLECIDDIATMERRYIARILRSVVQTPQRHDNTTHPSHLSDKLEKLLSHLPTGRDLVGIIFVKQRATAAVLAKILSSSPRASKWLRVATILGTSQSSKRSRSLRDLIEGHDKVDTLERFRNGLVNLVVATSVLNEGIDVPACNLVFCFDQPDNLKTFVQRRGRARQQKSTLVLMQPRCATNSNLWQSLETEMKAMYADKSRKLREIEDIEEAELCDDRYLRVKGTGALLNLDNAISHLNHFCAVLPARSYVNLTPEYIFVKGGYTRVILPLSVDSSLRETSSRYMWQSETNGKKDAAYEAYTRLHRAGLVSDHLLPLHNNRDEDAAKASVQKRASVARVRLLFDPWRAMCDNWMRGSKPSHLNKTDVKIIKNTDLDVVHMEMLLPMKVPDLVPFRLYWDHKISYLVSFGPVIELQDNIAEQVLLFNGTTHKLLDLAFGHRFDVQMGDFVAPFHSHHLTTSTDTMPAEITTIDPFADNSNLGLVRNKDEKSNPFIFKGWLQSKPQMHLLKSVPRDYENWPADVSYIAVDKFPRRQDFLHPVSERNRPESAKEFTSALPVSRCTLDSVPFRAVQLALFWPSILYAMSEYFVACQLNSTILPSINLEPELILTALTASSASSVRNYQRLEFLGDTCLKTCTSLQLLAKFPLFHEGYLSGTKDHIVSNGRLAQAAIDTGLDEFIITKAFTGKKWRPLYVSQCQKRPEDSLGGREMSTKVLADVVESLIGASMLSGGLSSAIACMTIFLPEVHYQSLEALQQSLFNAAPTNLKLYSQLKPLKDMLGYTFTKPSLLNEAMTHASCSYGTASYERLEYLGDAILDYIITTKIFSHEPALTHVQMHRLRTALVNADFLAFLSMELATTRQTAKIVEQTNENQYGRRPEKNFEVIETQLQLPLWKFIRHSSAKLSSVQVVTSARHAQVRSEIKHSLEHGDHYPWAALARLQALKVYSDVIESLLGAIYIDSGSFEAVETVMETLGILPYMRRALQCGDRISEGGIKIWHPKEELGVLANTETVSYIPRTREVVGNGSERAEWLCEVRIGDMVVCEVDGGVSKEEVKVKAATEAVRILRSKKCMAEEGVLDGDAEGAPTGDGDDDKNEHEEMMNR